MGVLSHGLQLLFRDLCCSSKQLKDCNNVRKYFWIIQNVGHQLLNVSRRETTYFDATGKAAYGQKRFIILLFV